MSIRLVLEGITAEIQSARSEPLKGHPLAHRITHGWRDVVADVVADPSYKVEGSAGRGNWAETVWLAVFDRTITESAQYGFYVVYLIAHHGERAYLSLNQGTTEIYNQVGGRKYIEVLADTAARDVGLLAREKTADLIEGGIDLEGHGTLTRGYEAGNIFAREYQVESLPTDNNLADDLTRFLLLYQSLVEGRDRVQGEATTVQKVGEGGIEATRYRWHRRVERSRSLAAEAKQVHGTTCQVAACRKNLSAIYGDVGCGYIEAHHLTPFSQLAGRPTKLDPGRDFAVVCPDCHRMIHQRAEPFSLEEVSTMIELA